MNKIFVKDVINLCKGKIIFGKEDETIEDIVRDTREVKKGDTYIGFKGEKNDGNLMYEQALKMEPKFAFYKNLA